MRCIANTLVILTATALSPMFSQNLLPNPSFETYTECPSTLNQGEPLQCIPWTQGNAGSTDYFNTCASPGNAGVPVNFAGNQWPVSGVAYTGVVAHDSEHEYREYVQAPLSNPLIAGTAYLVTFYISPGDEFCGTKPFGALFTVDTPQYNGYLVLDYNPQIEVYGEYLNDFSDWTLISRCFIADGGENYITIGNFRDDNETLIEPGCNASIAYYYIDHVSVEAMSLTEDVFEMDPVVACDSFEIFPGQAQNYTWSDGTTLPTLTVYESGTYYVTLSNACAFSYGEIEVTIIPDSPPVALPGDTTLCAGETFMISLDPDAGDYAWQDGSTDSDYTITNPGEYIAELTDNCDVTSDTIIVEFLDAPEPFSLGGDTLICDGDAYAISFDPTLGDFMWQDGSDGSSFTINEDGIYALTISNLCGQSEDAIEVGFVEPIDFSIGPEQTILCDGDQILIELDPNLGVFEWHDMSTESSYLISSGGIASVTITNACFSESDEMGVTVVEAPVFSLGADITVCPGQLPLTFDLSGVAYAEDYLWDDGFTGSIQQINTAGTHGVTISNSCYSISDEIQIIVLDSDPIVTLPSDQVLCQGQSVVLDASGIGGTYLWQDMSTADTFLVTTPGTYALTVTNVCGSGADTVVIDYVQNLNPPDLGPDFSLCPGETGVLYANVDGVTYQWNTSTGSVTTADSLIITEPDTYILQITDACSSVSDTIVVTSNANPPDVDLPESIDLCEGDTVVIDAGVTGVQYLWNDASTGSATTEPEIIVTTSGIYYLQVSNACGTDADTIVIIDAGPVPTVSLGADLAICPGDVVNVIPVSLDVETWLWNDSSTSSLITVSSAGVVYVQGSNQCGLASDTIQVTLLPAMPPLDLGEDLSICPGETVTLAINEPNVDILWHDGTTIAEFVVSNPGVIYASIANDCGTASDSVHVSLLDAPPSLELGADQSLCPGETIIFDPGISNVDYQWNDGSTEETLQATNPGTIILTISNACGSATDTVLVIADTDGPQVNLGEDILACEGDVVILEAGISGVNYLWQDGSVASQYVATLSGTYHLQVSNACGSDADTVIVDIHGTIPAPYLGADTSLCEGEVLTLISEADAETAVLWHDGSDESQFVVSQPGIYSLQETNHCGSGIDSIIISYEAAPDPFDLGEEITLCPGDSVVLFAPATTALITWHASTGSAAITPTFVVDTTTIVTLTISNDCGVSSDDLLVVIDDLVPSLSLDPTVTLCGDEEIVLDVMQPFVATYSWSTGSILPSIQVTEPGDYSVSVSTNCITIEDAIQVIADSDCDHTLFIPNVFSPNGDNMNDEWVVHITDPSVTRIECRIFDRWGDLVFGTKTEPIVWDGKFGEKEILPGVFVYVLRFTKNDGAINVVSGDVTVIR